MYQQAPSSHTPPMMPLCACEGERTCTMDGNVRIELSGSDDRYARDLKACTGECDADTQCAKGLKCFQRSKGEPIPGCTGPGNGPDWDYCYDPAWEAGEMICASGQSAALLILR